MEKKAIFLCHVFLIGPVASAPPTHTVRMVICRSKVRRQTGYLRYANSAFAGKGNMNVSYLSNLVGDHLRSIFCCHNSTPERVIDKDKEFSSWSSESQDLRMRSCVC